MDYLFNLKIGRGHEMMSVFRQQISRPRHRPKKKRKKEKGRRGCLALHGIFPVSADNVDWDRVSRHEMRCVPCRVVRFLEDRAEILSRSPLAMLSTSGAEPTTKDHKCSLRYRRVFFFTFMQSCSCSAWTTRGLKLGRTFIHPVGDSDKSAAHLTLTAPRTRLELVRN
ncbi:hypothetical protein C8F01DRAFT_1122496 [Mycena amicta]|nr:hypothetical protein C8F01DRAFT_1122496 [Mycena amicta]